MYRKRVGCVGTDGQEHGVGRGVSLTIVIEKEEQLVLYHRTAQVAAELTRELGNCAASCIGDGKGTAGQVLVLHDMLGMNLGKMARFVHNFMQDAGSVRGAMEAYVAAVKHQSFPDDALHAW